MKNNYTVTRGDHFVAGVQGPPTTEFTLTWLAFHRNRLWSAILGFKHLTFIVIWDTKGGEYAPEKTDADIAAMRQIVFGKGIIVSNRKESPHEA